MMRTLLALVLCVPTLVFAKEVTLDNRVRAETDHMIRQNIEAYGLEVGQPVIRQSMHVMNQDHYSFVEAKPGTYRLTEEEVLNGSWSFPEFEPVN